MKKLFIGSGFFLAFIIGFLSVFPTKESKADTWYTVYQYNKRRCNSVNTTTNLCTSTPINSTVYQTVYLAAPASAACPAPGYVLVMPGTINPSTGQVTPPIYEAWVSAGSFARQSPGLACSTGPQ